MGGTIIEKIVCEWDKYIVTDIKIYEYRKPDFPKLLQDAFVKRSCSKDGGII